MNLCAPRVRLSDWNSMVVGTSTKPPFNLYSSIRLALVRLQARLHCKVSIILVTAPGDLSR